MWNTRGFLTWGPLSELVSPIVAACGLIRQAGLELVASNHDYCIIDSKLYPWYLDKTHILLKIVV